MARVQSLVRVLESRKTHGTAKINIYLIFVSLLKTWSMMILILKMFLPPISKRKTEATKQDILQSPQPTTIFSFSLRGRVGSLLFRKPNYPTSFGFKQLSSLFFFLLTWYVGRKSRFEVKNNTQFSVALGKYKGPLQFP